jgi:aminopeptidase N
MMSQAPRVHLCRAAAGLAATALMACEPATVDFSPGVPLELAEYRAGTIKELHYALDLVIPESSTAPVTGTVTISFDLSSRQQPLILDFRAPAEQVRAVRLNGDEVDFEIATDHILIPRERLQRGTQSVTIEFTSADDALNRQDDFLYALFVPDRASTAFPVFEQPDLKARFALTMTVPAAWSALSNGALLERDSTAGTHHRLRFAETEPISTYLFAFAAGDLRTETAERNGRTYTLYHRETDTTRVARNREAIFDLHAIALQWLEAYTGIPYPFGKFDFLAVPAFQFGGMEHPGAIWYRAESLFLDPTAGRAQELGRASLIAHETAHMWFGDLVTMRWFNDVWMKEVFANFLAAKIAGPAFPDINLDLRFFQAHHPAAYGVDRTAGANPIRQELENLREAGSLYGAIIYQKAPVVMRQLEQLVGDSTLQEGLRRYLSEFQFGNATWTDLIVILDELTETDLSAWSQAWVEEPGRPRITAAWADSGIMVRQQDPDSTRGLHWHQPIVLALGMADSIALARVELRGPEAFIPWPGAGQPEFMLPGADGIGYGRFVLDSASQRHLLVSIPMLEDPVHRAVAWQGLQEEMLDGRLPPRQLFDAALRAIPSEPEELLVSQLLGVLRGTYWRFLGSAERLAVAPDVERVLWQELERAPTAGRKGAYFGAIQAVTLTEAGVARLERIWRRAETVPGLPLTEPQFIGLAEALAIRGVSNARAILDEQEGRITNPDRLARFRFVRPAFDQDPGVRDSLFGSFQSVEQRRRESWVLDAMGALHHPLRAEAMRHQIRPALELVEPIQQTGDIFFPLRWMHALLDGHRSPEAADIVREFLAERTDLPPRLRGKLLQAADGLFRAAGDGER